LQATRAYASPFRASLRGARCRNVERSLKNDQATGPWHRAHSMRSDITMPLQQSPEGPGPHKQEIGAGAGAGQEAVNVFAAMPVANLLLMGCPLSKCSCYVLLPS